MAFPQAQQQPRHPDTTDSTALEDATSTARIAPVSASAIRHEDILFPSQQQPSMSALLSGLRRTTLTIHNRLQSIQADAEFVHRAAQAYGSGSRSSASRNLLSTSPKLRCRSRPLVANERCGSWYIRPELNSASAYFKSTDGHERAWKFSTRRLNLHIVDLADAHDGVIIVDSTRRGKRMPDALSTTIPIWCTVLNLALLPNNPLSRNLFLPPYISASTHSQIYQLIPSFVSSLLDLKAQLPSTLKKPLRPFWVTQDSELPVPGDDDRDRINSDNEDHDDPDMEQDTPVAIYEDYCPIICCTASKRVIGSEIDEGGYIQGAGDDTENWAHGLTPSVFWANIEPLLQAAEADLPVLIKQLVQQHLQNESLESSAALPATAYRQLSPYIATCPLSFAPQLVKSAELDQTNNTRYIVLTQQATPRDSWCRSHNFMEVGLAKSKTASRNLRLALGDICSFAQNTTPLDSKMTESTPVNFVIACESGKDLSVGTSLALSCYLFDDDGHRRPPGQQVTYTKTLIKRRLAGFMTAYPEANPSRATLQSVNSFLMDWRN